MAKIEEIQKHIQSLRASVPDLRGVLLASGDGLPVAHSLSEGVDAQRFAAMAAAAAGLGRKVGESLGIGSLGEVGIGGADGQVFIYAVGTKAILAVIGSANANTGLIHLEARSVARSLAEAF